MPMERLAPARVRIAASTLAAFMSLSLVLAISSSCARVILPTLSFSGILEPLSSLIAFLIRTVAGGVLMMKVKLLSANAVITTGSGRPGSTPWVWALNALQNSMMFRPRWPSAGPIGGDGFALPAGTCSLIKPTIFFAMLLSYVGASGHRSALPGLLRLLGLAEFQLHRGRAAENRDRDAQSAFLVVHVFHRALEVGERAILHAHHL